ncbi:hypothetical protein MKL26_00915 [Streptococcus suis]|nr:hypothetical protein [Streptococcus suis]
MAEQNQEQLYAVVLQTLTTASQLPMVKVNREEFLKTRFKDSPYLDKILADGPTAVFSLKALRKEADKIITDMTTKTTLLAFAAGLPGNPFTAVVAGTADIVQYFGFALNLSQQIAYLFGEDELFVSAGKEISEETQIRVIAYIGVMFGAGGAAVLLNKVYKAAGTNIGKKVAAQALMKTTWYPLVKKVAAVIGVKITKKTVEKTIANAVPILGGLISGGLTYFTFQPMGGQLADAFVRKLSGDFDSELELNEAFKASLAEERRLGIVEAEFTETNAESNSEL